MAAQSQRGNGSRFNTAFSGKSRDRTVLAILNAAFGLLFAVMLLVLQGIPPLLWLGQGIAAPIQWFTAAALLLDRKMLQNTAVLPLLFFGTLPMLASPWGGWWLMPQLSRLVMWWLMPQLSRLVMTVTALYILGESVIGRKYREMAVGLAAGGVAVLLLFLILPWCCGG
ncbi:MAG: hypothetical protein LUP93_04615 [Methanomicrobiales archaeon]|nr:hypothetical protein [Methanomicrobiales archaeon]